MSSPSNSEVHIVHEAPHEIRLKVWKTAANETRNVDIWVRNLYITPADECQSFWAPYYLYTGAKVPSILQVSHESRVEALKYYTLDFGTKFRHHRDYYNGFYPAVEIKFPPQIYINWKVDRICLMRPEDFQEYITTDNNESKETKRIQTFVQKCNKMKLRHLAVNVESLDPDNFWGFDSDSMNYPMFTDLVPRGGHLEELILFHHNQWEKLNSDFDWDKRKVKGDFGFEDVDEEDEKELDAIGEAQDTFNKKLWSLFADDHPKVDDLGLAVENFVEGVDFRFCKVEYSTPQNSKPLR